MGDLPVSVVLGGTRGIGGAIARILAEPETTLVLNHLQDRRRAELLAAELESLGAKIILVEGNIGDKEIQKEIVAAVDEAGGRCRHLVHSVAVTSFKPLSAVKPRQWDLIFAISARTLLEMAVALEGPLEKAGGAIVAISSQGSVRHVPNYGALGPAKAALEAVVRELAVEYGPRGVRVNAVRAGLVESEVLDHLPPESSAVISERTPLGRLGTPAEIAAAAHFLLGPGAAWITGQVLDVDGGFSVV